MDEAGKDWYKGPLPWDKVSGAFNDCKWAFDGKETLIFNAHERIRLEPFVPF